MGTPAFIGIQRPKEQIQGVYCHHGHIEHLGPMLYQHYKTFPEVQELIDLGQLSSVEETTKDSRSYFRDLGRKSGECESIVVDDILELRKKHDRYYFYFIFMRGQWHVSVDGRWYHPLKDALEQMNCLPE